MLEYIKKVNKFINIQATYYYIFPCIAQFSLAIKTRLLYTRGFAVTFSSSHHLPLLKFQCTKLPSSFPKPVSLSSSKYLKMKFFNWVQNKINGKQGSSSKLHTVSATDHMKQEPRQEFNDWPHGLLTIGTFGNNNETPRSQNVPGQDRFDTREDEQEPSSSEDFHEFTPEEVGKLEKELTKLLSRKPDVKKELANLPLDRWLNCPSSLEIDRRNSNALCSDSGDKSDREDTDRTVSVILGRCKDICAANKKKSIGKKSISFLLKKMFVCSGGFSPAASLRDTLPESKMEKLLRVMLHKKIYNQNPSRESAMKKYLEDGQTTSRRQNNEDETQESRKSEDGCKWVKTDSEYIVLEI